MEHRTLAYIYLQQFIVFIYRTSDENLLKNLEMFDRLALRFNGRIHFIKDAIGPAEICCWRFYGNGKKFAEVCCTSIVYATDRKHTKVEFPEARIYEETLNSFLYENRPGPDQELMRATSVPGAVGRSVAGVTNCTSDEEEEKCKNSSSAVHYNTQLVLSNLVFVQCELAKEISKEQQHQRVDEKINKKFKCIF